MNEISKKKSLNKKSKLTKVKGSYTMVALELDVVSCSFSLDAGMDVCGSQSNSPNRLMALRFQTTCKAMTALW